MREKQGRRQENGRYLPYEPLINWKEGKKPCRH